MHASASESIYPYAAGTSAFLAANRVLHKPIDVGDEDEKDMTECNKETGEKIQLRKCMEPWYLDVRQWRWVDPDMAAAVQVSDDHSLVCMPHDVDRINMQHASVQPVMHVIMKCVLFYIDQKVQLKYFYLFWHG